MPSDRRRAIVSDDEIATYLQKKATRFSQKLKKKQSTYDKFLWIKKVTRDVLQLQSNGGLDHYFSLEAELERQRQRQSEVQRLRDRKIKIQTLRERKPEEKARTSHHSEADSENYKPLKAHIDGQAMPEMEDAGEVHEKDDDAEVEEAGWVHEKDDDSEDHQARKPKFVTRVHTGYEWSKYNRTHYDRENPPPKFVRGYKFEVRYPDLADKKKPPMYDILRDGDSTDTCIIRFRVGPPYQDIAFRIVNSDWDYSMKNGFKSTFEGGVLRVYFNFKRYGYRR